MNIKTGTKVSARLRLVASASIAAIAMASAPAFAQDADSGADSDEGDSDNRIVVTGSRLIRSTADTPVPVTVVNAEELESMNPTSLISAISNLPQFYGNETPNTSAFFTRGGTGNLNLRGLGINRTLTLLNGRRFPSSSAFGGVDINLFPEAMIASVETTTGGASAAYGTDAVAGVVNFVLDTNFTGIELGIQGGTTERGDADSYEGSLSWGADLGDRGHFLVSGSIAHQDGIIGYGGREWYQSQGALLDAGTNTWRDISGMHTMNTSFDGIVLSPGTSLEGTAFDSAGNLFTFEPGALTQGTYGRWAARTAGGDGDDLNEVSQIWPETERYSVFAYADYEVADNFNVFAQFTRGQNRQKQNGAPPAALLNFVPVLTSATIYSGNAFLPADVQAIMDAEGIESFNLGRIGHPSDFGGQYYEDTSTQNVGTIGFDAEIDGDGLFGGWTLAGYYQYGHSKRVWDQFGFRVDRIHAALDAVDDGSGNIVCNVSLTADGAAAYPGCVPLNPFGRGNASAAAVDYVTGTDPGQQITTPIAFADSGFDLGQTYSYTTGDAKRNITTFKQHLAELSFAGDVWEGWGAGPIGLAVGASYRKESVLQLVQDPTNQASDHIDGHPVLCPGEVANLRHAGTDCNNTVGFQFSKVSNIMGESQVKEAFAETLIPLFDTGSGTNAELSAAVRWADYDTSGVIWAYKVGVDFSVFDDLRLRGTYSRDVRAGNLSERFDRTGGFANNLVDPRDGSTINGVTSFSGGNPAVNPEKADTLTAGLVYQPSWAPSLSFAVDWYQIKIQDAISQVGLQEVLNQCFDNMAPEFCDLITLDSSGALILIGDAFVNVAEAAVEGVDVEFGYRDDVSLFGGDETLSARVFASWLIERSNNQTDFVGDIGLSPADGAAFPYPRFKATGNITYNNGPFAMFLQGRIVGGGVRDPDLLNGAGVVGGTAGAENNDVPATFYADLRLSYDLEVSGADVQLWGAVSNLLDQDPRITPYYGAFPGQVSVTNTGLYDVLGRRFTIGVKVKL